MVKGADKPAPTTVGNPYPGLRPFRTDEEHLFFGREEQVDRMVAKLATHHFLAVVGSSGSGKSSLVNCGLRPALHRGYMAGAGANWRMAQFRPGSHPIRALACALAERGVLFDEPLTGALSSEDLVDSTLRLGSLGLVQLVEQADLPPGTQLLLVVDQFEELFRFRRAAHGGPMEGSDSAEDAVAFVHLLLEAAAQWEVPIYVVLTMRSDFLGDCARFHGLPEAINQSQYLVPRLTRDEIRAAITGPAAVAFATLSPVLTSQLLNDVGDSPDQLSILQHALNRTWARWEGTGSQGPLELTHYKAIGTMARALDQHAERAYAELATPRQRQICEKLFKALTDKATDPRGVRRPTPLGTLCALADATMPEVIDVIDVFRKQSRSFLMPPAAEVLTAQTVIDISHESLMRVWQRLDQWADEEAEWARIFRRLAETAVLHAHDQASLWRDPDLQLALDWRDHSEPNVTWAERYHPGFVAAMGFLDESRQAREAEKAEREMQRRREVEATEQRDKAEVHARSARRMRRAAGVSTALAVVAIAAGGLAYRAQDAASASENDAKLNLVSAHIERARSADKEGERSAALFWLLDAYDVAPDGDPRRVSALRLIGAWAYRFGPPVDPASDPAGAPTSEPRSDTPHEIEGTCASFQQAISSAVFDPGGTLLDRLIKRPYFVRLGPQAPRLVSTQDWARTDRGAGVDCLADEPPPAGGAAVVAASNGDRPQAWPPLGSDERVLASSADGKRAVTWRPSHDMRLWDRNADEPKTLEGTAEMGHGVASEGAVAFDPKGEHVVVGLWFSPLVWDAATAKLLRGAESMFFDRRETAGPPPDYIVLRPLAASLDGSRVLTFGLDSPPGDGTGVRWGTLDDNAQLWDARTGKHLRTLEGAKLVNMAAFSPDGKRIVTVGGKPRAWRDFPPRIWDADSGELIHELVGKAGHTKITVDTAYSPDGRRISTTSEDGTVRLWDADSGLLVAVIKVSKVWPRAVVFSPDGVLTLSTTRDGYARLSDVETGLRVDDFKTTVDRSRRATFSPDGMRIAVGGGEEEPGTSVWRLRPPACSDADWLRLSIEVRTGRAWDNEIRQIYVLTPAALEERQVKLQASHAGKFCDVREWKDLGEEELSALRGPTSK